MDANRHQLTQLLKREAYRLGFESVGVCPAVTPAGVAWLYDWLACGYAGEMDYFARRAGAYEDPRHVLGGVRSLVMMTVNYNTRAAGPAGPGQGRVSRMPGAVWTTTIMCARG